MSNTTDIAHPTEQRGTVPAVMDSAGMLAMIADAASNPAVVADKMVTLAKLAKELRDDERQERFSRDKVACFAKLPAVFKDKYNGGTKSSYATWEAIHARVMPILSQHNFTLAFDLGSAGNQVTVEAVLEHANGIKLRGGPLSFPIDDSGSKNKVQGVASTVAYGKRVTGKAILNIIESNTPEDTDGQGDGGPTLQPFEADLLEKAEAEANNGPTSYMDWFKTLDAASKGWLVFGKHHDRFKEHAANL